MNRPQVEFQLFSSASAIDSVYAEYLPCIPRKEETVWIEGRNYKVFDVRHDIHRRLTVVIVDG